MLRPAGGSLKSTHNLPGFSHSRNPSPPHSNNSTCQCHSSVKLTETSLSFLIIGVSARSKSQLRNKVSLTGHANDVAQYGSTSDSACVYLCGNSLGACPKQSQVLIQEELNAWGKLYASFAYPVKLSGLNVIQSHSAVEGHFHHPHGRPWTGILDQVHPLMAEIVGKKCSREGEG